ncbi:HAMP domain-containing histidine kinase [Puteibacter caeruleilacunae]|nr:HAMP domain-containing histidine kinase [Puteibacter caeruleilacunae]
MSKRFITTLIVSMAIVMVCLILVQVYSIKNATEIKEDQFGHAVNRVLSNVVDKLEAMEVYNMILEESRASYSQPGLSYPGLSSFDPNTAFGGKININFNFNNQSGKFRADYQISSPDSLTAIRKRPSFPRGRPGDFPSAFSQLYEYHDYQQEQLQQKLKDQTILLRTVRSMTLLSYNPIEKRVDPEFLKKTLQKEFQNSEIKLDYKYAVINYEAGQNRFIAGDSDFDIEYKKKYREYMFPNSFDVKANYLFVYFPEQRSFLLKSTGFLLIPSVVLIVLILAIFILTINIILRQKKLSNVKNDFINNMTHELKTPISTISLASQMLKDNSVSNTPKTIEHVSNVIYQESKRLSFQVEKVLQMAVFNEGRLKLKFREFDFNELLETVIRNSELKVKNKGGEIESTLSATVSVVKGDDVHITNVLFNLIDNAVKYSKESPHIQISTENKKEFIVVSIKDNGIGIAKEHVGQIFERFYRVPTGNVHDVKGFGLGLSYVKKIVDAHSGVIKVESVLNKGTKFMLYFPLNNK